jgi:ABC-type branched-subunit amino acid transport system substrate-binding protein
LNTYIFAAYDCARLLIDAISRAIDANAGRIPTRLQVLQAVAHTQGFKGVTGTYSFDANGDAISPLMSISEVQNGGWVYLRQVDASANPSLTKRQIPRRRCAYVRKAPCGGVAS